MNEVWSLVVNDKGDMVMPLEQRSPQTLQGLNNAHRMVVVIPTYWATIHQVELPWLSAKKARVALTYALEEQLAEPVDEVHVAYSRYYFHQNRYTVAVLSHALMEQILDKCKALNIEIETLTLDWFALNEGETCIITDYLLIHDKDYQGALTKELVSFGLQTELMAAPVLAFTDSDNSLMVDKTVTSHPQPGYVWLAKRLSMKKTINLCQGRWQQPNHKEEVGRNGLKWLFGLAACCLLSFILLKISALVVLNKKINTVDSQIAIIYRQFFPKASEIISPKFRISQLLAAGSSEGNKLWLILEKLAEVFEQTPFTIEQLRWQQSVLTVTLNIKNFVALEQVEQQLKQKSLQVVQTQAASEQNKVKALLELSA